MKKYLIMIVLTFISICTLGIKSIDANTNKSSSQVGITFIDDHDEKEKDALPSTGTITQNDLVLWGAGVILLALFLRKKSQNK